jgi:hypothetical protein
MERPNQPSLTECCRGKGKEALPKGRADRTMFLKRTQGTSQAVREDTHLSKAIEPRYRLMQAETVFNGRNPKRTDRQGEVWEGLPGSESMAREEREARNLGGPFLSRKSGKCPQRQGEALMGERESDRLVVAGEGPKSPNQPRGRRDGVSRRGNRSSANG